MLKLLFKLALHINLAGTLRTAAKLEYGAGIFCFKLALRAEEEGYLNLAKYLKKQYAEEDAHARMLGGLVDGGSRLKRNCPQGLWTKEGYEPLDGISQRYWSSKLFFWFAKPEELEWFDTLAFMWVVEKIVVTFYEVLSQVEDFSISAVAAKILNDEIEQAEYLKLSLACFHSCPGIAISKWQNRVFWGCIGAVLDLEKFFRNQLTSKHFPQP